MSDKKKSEIYYPEVGRDYEARTAVDIDYSVNPEGVPGEEFMEMLVDGLWWRVDKVEGNPKALLLSNPTAQDDPTVRTIDE